MANSNKSKNEPINVELTYELVKKSQALREKHKNAIKAFNSLKERTEKFLISEKNKGKE